MDVFVADTRVDHADLAQHGAVGGEAGVVVFLDGGGGSGDFNAGDVVDVLPAGEGFLRADLQLAGAERVGEYQLAGVEAAAGVGVALVINYFYPSTMGISLKFIVEGLAFMVIYFGLLMIFERQYVIPLFKKLFSKVKGIAKAKQN